MTTYVRFIKNKDGTIEGCFMKESAELFFNGRHWERKCYPSGTCHEDKTRRKRATPEEYKKLLKEMKSVGYTDITIV